MKLLVIRNQSDFKLWHKIFFELGGTSSSFETFAEHSGRTPEERQLSPIELHAIEGHKYATGFALLILKEMILRGCTAANLAEHFMMGDKQMHDYHYNNWRNLAMNGLPPIELKQLKDYLEGKTPNPPTGNSR